MADNKLTFALAGNPNCGKTTLFNSLTGSTAYVGNWPGVTVEKRTGSYLKSKNEKIEIVDLPGIYSLSPYSPEEVISRNYILEEKPDCVINVVDGTNLERNLYMTTQILEMDVPVVVAINMVDVLNKNGQVIDCNALSAKLKVPVIPVSALKKDNLDNLMREAIRASKMERQGYSVLASSEYKDQIEESKKIYTNKNIDNPLFHAIKALEKDEIEAEKNKEVYSIINPIDDFDSSSADKRYEYIVKELACYRTGEVVKEKEKLSKSDKIDKVLTHKWFGIPILIAIFFIIFHIVFTGDLLFLGAFGVDFGEGYQGLVRFMVGGEEFAPFDGLFFTEGGINGFGEFLHCLAGDNETGILGLLCLGVKNLLITAEAPEWIIGLVYDGALNGVAAVLGFVPQIMLLFAFFSIMEDSGYMARVAFILDRIFRRFGVSGRAFIPMIMGFGCGVPAMMNTRTLASDKERTKTIRVIPFFTCGAKAEFLAVIAATIASVIGLDAGLFTFLVYLLGVLFAIVSVIVMNKTTQREEIPPFIMELPSYHTPQLYALWIHVWDKGKHFIIKASTIILTSTIVIWFLANFGFDSTGAFTMLEENGQGSILSYIGNALSYIFTPLGFGVQAGENSWVYAVSTIQGIIAKENVTAVTETLAATLGVDGFEGIVEATNLTVGGILSFGVFNMLTIPCFASVGTAWGELKDKKTFWGTIAFWLLSSYLFSSFVYLSVEFVWTLAITLPLIALSVVGIVLYDRKKNKEEKALI